MIRKAEIPIIVSQFDNMNFIIFNKEEHLQRSWYKQTYAEPDMLKFIEKNYKGGTFIDIGSCIGNHTLFFSKLADKVISFEAFEKNHFHQKMNIIVNNIENVDLYNIFVGDIPEVVTFTPPPESNVGGGHANDRNPVKPKKEILKDKEKSIKIPSIPLDPFNFKDIKLIKIDVEGFEMFVLDGARKTLKKECPDLWIECHTQENRDEILEFLQKHINKKYRVYKEYFNYTPTYLFTLNNDEYYKV